MYVFLSQLLKRLESCSPFREICKEFKKGTTLIKCDGAWGAFKGYLAAGLLKHLSKPVLYITSTQEEAERASGDIGSFLEGGVYLFPAREKVKGEWMEVGAEAINERLVFLEDMIEGQNNEFVVVAPIEALTLQLPPPARLRESTLKVERGMHYQPHALSEKLANMKYEHVHLVERPGQFSLRGGILDVFPPTDEEPVRIEFLGNIIESIRKFSPITQRSHGEISFVHIPPRDEGGVLSRESVWLGAYLPEDILVVLDEPLYAMHRLEELGSEGKRGWNYIDTIIEELKTKKILAYSLLGQYPDWLGEGEVVKVQLASAGDYRGTLSLLVDEVKGWLNRGYTVYVVGGNEDEVRRLEQFFEDKGIVGEENFKIRIGHLQCGFVVDEIRLVLITSREIFGLARRRRRRYVREGPPVRSPFELEVGDLVVHVEHGIGRYLGVVPLRIDGKRQEFLAIEYQDGDKLYVPLHQISLVQKYIGVEGFAPRISKLGSPTWQLAKKKAKEAAREMAQELLRLAALRQTKRGHAFSPDTPWQIEFEASFPYEETEGQLRAIEDVKRDMESQKPMDRLICGDVGFGKTEVAMRASFKAVMDGKQVAVLVPTTILAEQHYRTFSERMKDYPINIEVLSRFRTRSEQKRILEELKVGKIDIIIGTHRLLQRDVEFHDLGLVIIDEEHRFGVAQKEHFKKLRETVDVLSLSATPIPRTLYMSLAGLRDLTTIDTPPPERSPIRTYIVEFRKDIIREAILREIARGGQVFFVHNRVQSIHSMASFLTQLVPEARIDIAHGQMNERDLEDVMLRFLNKEIDVLLCTMIIGSGLDITNANTIIINRADTFGLADLYQLRGRVGRFRQQAFAYLLIPARKALSEEARQRLRAMEEFALLGSSYQLALRDLQIRGAGNLLGPEQHGHIGAVGFELYCQLLRDVVAELKGEELPQVRKAAVDIGVEAYIPDDYIPEPSQKLSFYRKLADVLYVEQIEQIRAEMEDIYGKLPPQVERLLSIVELRIEAAEVGIESISRRGDTLVFRISTDKLLTPHKARGFFAEFGDRVEFEGAFTLLFKLTDSELEDDERLLECVIKVLKKMELCGIISSKE